MPERHIYFWSALALFSIVNLTSTLDLIPNKRDHWDRDHKWVVSVPSISLCLSGFGVICNILMKDKFMGSKGEAGMVGKDECVGQIFLFRPLFITFLLFSIMYHSGSCTLGLLVCGYVGHRRPGRGACSCSEC
jgi:hypothetical protein